MPGLSSPILVGSELYWVSDNGLVSCADAHTGKIQWQERLGGLDLASLISAQGCLYFFLQNTRTVVVKAGKTLERLAENPMEGSVIAPPAVGGRALFLRTDTHPYCLRH